MQPALDFKPVVWISVLALIFLTVTASPLISSHTPNSLVGRHSTDYTTVLGRLHRKSQNDPEYQAGASELEVRDSELDIIHAERLRIIVPTSLAAQSLAFFYRALWVKASEDWAQMEPKATLSMTIGNLVITMVSTDPIPWAFIARFAAKMMEATARGFTGTYNIQYGDKTATRLITIGLRVVDHITGLQARSNLGSLSGHKAFHISTGHNQRRSLPNDSSLKPSAKPSNRPRNDGPLGTRLAIQRFHARAIITPVIVAARFLEDFYDMIAMKIEAGSYNDMTPLHTVSFQRWDYNLSFFCYQSPIPWDFIQEIAITMSDYAARGFTPAFEAIYHRIDELGKDIYVTITFKVLEEKAPIGGIPGLDYR